jgi:hypothetical protein
MGGREGSSLRPTSVSDFDRNELLDALYKNS